MMRRDVRCTKMIIAASLGGLLAACSAEKNPDPIDPVDQQGSNEPVPHLNFSDSRASSRHDGDMITTELHDLADGLLATAEWDVAAHRGTVTIVDSGVAIDVVMGATTDVNFGSTNQLTHTVWVGQTADETSYEYDCTTVMVGCGCCWFRSCSECYWYDEPDYGPVYQCDVVASETWCATGCQCADEGPCGGCGCNGCCGNSCCI